MQLQAGGTMDAWLTEPRSLWQASFGDVHMTLKVSHRDRRMLRTDLL
jgi:hypothetical protein